MALPLLRNGTDAEDGHSFPDDSPVTRAVAEAGEAVAVALSQISGVHVHASNLTVRMLPLTALSAIGGLPDDDVVALFLKFSGSDSGQILLIFSLGQARILADQMLLHPPGTTTEIDGMALSALTESGNILGSHFLTAIARITDAQLSISTPEPRVDIRETALKVAATAAARGGDSFLSIQLDFTNAGGLDLGATLLVMPDDGIHSTMMRRLT